MSRFCSFFTAYHLLRRQDVMSRLGLRPEEAERLGLALVVDADNAPDLARKLLANHAETIDYLERQEAFSSARPDFDEKGNPLISYELSVGTRHCLALLEALRRIINCASPEDRAA